jgi:hypothetical protein
MLVTKPLSFVALALVLLSPLTAQGTGSRAMPNYDPQSEITFDGEISEVSFPESPMGWKGVHLRLTTDEGVRIVHLGPAAYVEDQGFSFTAGDRIEVIGSRVKCDGEDVVLAREVSIGERRLRLRDETGRPLWAGRR